MIASTSSRSRVHRVSFWRSSSTTRAFSAASASSCSCVVRAHLRFTAQDPRPQVDLFDLPATVLDRRRCGGAAETDPGAGGVEQTQRLVGQLPARDVAAGQPDGIDDRLVQDAHLVVLFQRLDEPAHHVDRPLFVGLLDLHHLEAASQRRVLFEVFLVLGPRGGRDRSQFAARECRLEQIGRISLPRAATGADQRVRLVDEEDDRAEATPSLP